MADVGRRWHPPTVITAIALLLAACGSAATPAAEPAEPVAAAAAESVEVAEAESVEVAEAGAEETEETGPVVDLEDGLIGYFPLDGDAVAGDGAADQSVGGQVVGAQPVADRFGGADMALRLNGDGDFVEFTDAAALNVAQDFSIAIWVELADGIGTDWYTLFEKSDPERGGHSRYGLWLHGGRPAACFEAEDNSQQPCVEASDPVPADGWHHVAAVRDGRRLILYLDGTEAANGFVGLHQVSQTDFNAFIGADTYQPNTPWLDAAVDDLRVYNRGLSAAEIAALAAS